MTAIERQACRSLKHVAYGRHRGDRRFGLVVARFASRPDWRAVQLTDRQWARVARQVRRYRRQIANPHLLFWAQRKLVALQQSSEPAGLALDFGGDVSA